MKLEQLRYIIEIAETKSITKAAQNLFMTQSNLSRSIKQIENELEKKILIRSNNGTFLTEFGERLYQKACEIIKSFDELNNIDNKKGNEFKISTVPVSFIYKTFTEFVNMFNKNDSNFRLYQTTKLSEVISDVCSKKSDIGFFAFIESNRDFVEKSISDCNLKFNCILSSQIYVYISKNNELLSTELKEISIDMLDSMTQINIIDKDDTNMYISNESFNKHNRKDIFVEDTFALIDMISRSNGYYLGIYHLYKNSYASENMRRIKLAGNDKKIYFGYILRNDEKINEIVERFIKLLKLNLNIK